MPFEEARRKILTGQMGFQLDSANHQLCLSWLMDKEALRRDLKEERNESIARSSLLMSKIAIIIAVISTAWSIRDMISTGIAAIAGYFSK